MEAYIFDKGERDARNEKHLANPEPGDYWQEMLCGACVVVKPVPGGVVICRTKVDTDPDHWTWNLEKLETLTLEEFREFLTYGGHTKGTWADVIPRSMGWVPEEVSNMNEVNNEHLH